ncbi:MAG: hypothetical protein EZS28_053332, partial [Streblomastix strix]
MATLAIELGQLLKQVSPPEPTDILRGDLLNIQTWLEKIDDTTTNPINEDFKVSLPLLNGETKMKFVPPKKMKLIGSWG